MLGTKAQCKTAASAVSDILHVEEKKNLEKQRKNSLNSSLIPVSVRVRAKYEGINVINDGVGKNGIQEKEECKVDNMINTNNSKNNVNNSANNNTKNSDENNTQNKNDKDENDQQSTLPSDTIFLEMLRSMSEMLNIGEGRKEREL